MDTILYKGGIRNEDGSWQETELPDVAAGFTLILDQENLPERNNIMRRIFQTVSSCFQPFLPPLEKKETIMEVRKWVSQINGLLELHGLSQIRVCLAEEKAEK